MPHVLPICFFQPMLCLFVASFFTILSALPYLTSSHLSSSLQPLKSLSHNVRCLANRADGSVDLFELSKTANFWPTKIQWLTFYTRLCPKPTSIDYMNPYLSYTETSILISFNRKQGTYTAGKYSISISYPLGWVVWFEQNRKVFCDEEKPRSLKWEDVLFLMHGGLNLFN